LKPCHGDAASKFKEIIMTKLNDIWAILTRSELWITISVIVGALIQSGSLPDGWTKVATILLAVLAALGYTAARTAKKISDNNTSSNP
jgi:phage-related minor tail protein